MQEKKNHFRSLGICHSLIDFFKNILIKARGVKRVTMGGPPLPQGSTNLPFDDSLMNRAGSVEDQQPMNGALDNTLHQALGKSSSDAGDKIPIQFQETDELGSWTPVDQLGYSIHVSEEKSPTYTGSQAHPLMSSEEKDQTEGNIIIGNISNGNGSVDLEIESIVTEGKSLSEEDEAEEAEKKQKEATQMKAPVRPHFGVWANINEISDVFIRSKKEEFSNSMEPRNS